MHHFFWGLILIIVSNWIALVGSEELHNLSAMILGVGVGMVTDEVGLLMTCGTFDVPCDYWAKPTMYVFISICAILLMIIYSKPATVKLNRLGKKLFKKTKKIIKILEW